MNVEISKKYFIIVSGRESLQKAFDKEDIEVIGNGPTKKYISRRDNSMWIDRFSTYDYVHEFSGIMRLPELSFTELWLLLQHSKIETNRIGALLIIEELYGRNLLEELQELHNKKITKYQRRALKLLKEYSLPYGVFHWTQNKNLNESKKQIVSIIWGKLDAVINELLK